MKNGVRIVAALFLAASWIPIVAVASQPAAATTTSAWSAYVANSIAGTIGVIDTATNTVTGTIDVGSDSDPVAVALTPDGSTAYVANLGLDSVSVINTTTDAVTSTIDVGSAPFAIAITPDGSTAYVVNSSSNSVSVIDTTTNAVTTTIDVGSDPLAVAITPDGSTAYVANSGSGTLSVIDTTTDVVTSTIDVGSDPMGIAITPDGSSAYVANSGSGTLSVINTATSTVTSTIAVGGELEGVDITPNGSTAYVANASSGAVNVINLSTTNVETIDVGTDPVAVAITPDGSTAYVTDEDSSNVSVIDTATLDVTATFGTDEGPAGIAMAPDQAPIAQLSVTPGSAGSLSVFNASASTVAYGTISSYRWSFGDGDTATTSTPTTTHSYAAAGDYSASVIETNSAGTSTTQIFTGQTVSNNGGPSATATTVVDVTAPITSGPRPEVPGAPTVLAATPASGDVSFSWIAPGYDGSSSIMGYSITCSPSGTTTTSAVGATISGLTNGTTYTCSVAATNSVGTGPASTFAAVTPEATTPPPASSPMLSVVSTRADVSRSFVSVDFRCTNAPCRVTASLSLRGVVVAHGNVLLRPNERRFVRLATTASGRRDFVHVTSRVNLTLTAVLAKGKPQSEKVYVK